MTVDFASYLTRIDPISSYEIELLTGGFVNFTVRARKTSAINCGAFPGTPSLVLKYAPPYIAAVGPEAPFSQGRQLTEAAALSLFEPGGPLHQLGKTSSPLVRIPEVLHHDATSSMLILEDLGPLVTLWDILTPENLGKITLGHKAIQRIYLEIGQRLGMFFGNLHSHDAEVLGEIIAHSEKYAVLAETLTNDVIYDAAVKPIRGRLGTHVAAEQLYRRVVDEYRREPVPAELAFSLGDCHPGAILVPSGTHLTDDEPVVAVIDWEFAAAAGRGVNGDMAQLFASLSCHLLLLAYLQRMADGDSKQKESIKKARTATESLISGVHSTYATRLKLDPRQSPSNPTMIMFRSALILHGREIINQAFEREWVPGERFPGLIADMVSAGAWYLEMSGDSAEEMLKPMNWTALQERASIIMGLFGINSIA